MLPLHGNMIGDCDQGFDDQDFGDSTGHFGMNIGENSVVDATDAWLEMKICSIRFHRTCEEGGKDDGGGGGGGGDYNQGRPQQRHLLREVKPRLSVIYSLFISYQDTMPDCRPSSPRQNTSRISFIIHATAKALA